MRHGSKLNPPNPYEAQHRVLDLEHLEWDQEYVREIENRRIEFIPDSSQSIVAENNSPDIPFRFSVNPYRGCIHACSYCYARPSHEFLGYNAGMDFETKIVVKEDAAKLLREFLSRDSWSPQPIVFSGVTDCYQPAERQFRLTRQCLEVAAECRQPIGIVTKNALVLRDLDVLQDLARDNLVHVFLSITTLDPELARAMEPRTSIPAARLRAISALADNGISVGVMAAPMIPGLNDAEMPAILEAAAQAGAMSASYTLLRLPTTVEPVFIEWIQRTLPEKSERVLTRQRESRGGKLNESTFRKRMVGTGEIAVQIQQMFQIFKQKHGLEKKLPPLNCDAFQPPMPKSGQLRLF